MCGHNGASGFKFKDRCRSCECIENRREEPAGPGQVRVFIERGLSCNVRQCRAASSWKEILECQSRWARVLRNFPRYIRDRRNRLE